MTDQTLDPKDSVLLSSMQEMASREGCTVDSTSGEWVTNPDGSCTRNLTQDELDGFWRYEFVKTVISHIESGKIARFSVCGEHSGKYRLIEVSKRTNGEWHFSISGMSSWYTYKYSDLIHFLEQLWDKSTGFISFEGEIQLTYHKAVANK